jgi:hypothetical protein
MWRGCCASGISVAALALLAVTVATGAAAGDPDLDDLESA